MIWTFLNCESWIRRAGSQPHKLQTPDPLFCLFFWSCLPLLFFWNTKTAFYFLLIVLKWIFSTNWKESQYKENIASFPSNQDILCEAFPVEAIKFAIWDFFPLRKDANQPKIRLINNHSQHVRGQWCGSKTFTTLPVCYHLFLSTNISLKCSGPGPSKAFSFFKVCFLSDEIAKFLHSFTLNQQWNRTWLLA